jgi:hypothetical protein
MEKILCSAAQAAFQTHLGDSKQPSKYKMYKIAFFGGLFAEVGFQIANPQT